MMASLVGDVVAVTQDASKMEEECRASALPWPDDHTGVEQANKLGKLGEVLEIDLVRFLLLSGKLRLVILDPSPHFYV